MSFSSLPAGKRKEIEESLSHFGLGENDRAVYIALLPLGRTTLTPIATAAGLRLTTAQSVMARLADLGLVEITKRGSRAAYEALDPSVLRKILERQSEELADVIPTLKALKSGESAGAAKLRVFPRERMNDIYLEALACKSRMIYEIVAGREIQDILGERFHFTKRRVEKRVKLMSLRIEAREIKRYSAATHVKELREAKFLPRELTFMASVMFWDDTVAFFTTKEEGLAWTVRSRALRETYQQLFTLLWDVSRRMETDPGRK